MPPRTPPFWTKQLHEYLHEVTFLTAPNILLVFRLYYVTVLFSLAFLMNNLKRVLAIDGILSFS